eukprot:TRINITY_DN11674_c3_g2_i2.p4 TRINITY_DN11674_c3_g2~~TRINITY_DN11674_c3_g2_i2.p4  ORF type:complete len:134 (-),score=10.73 TRINITY_DN11674_c3_g2_i2:95-496(-)
MVCIDSVITVSGGLAGGSSTLQMSLGLVHRASTLHQDKFLVAALTFLICNQHGPIKSRFIKNRSKGAMLVPKTWLKVSPAISPGKAGIVALYLTLRTLASLGTSVFSKAYLRSTGLLKNFVILCLCNTLPNSS